MLLNREKKESKKKKGGRIREDVEGREKERRRAETHLSSMNFGGNI